MRGFLRFFGVVVLVLFCLGMGLAGGIILDRLFLIQTMPTTLLGGSPSPAATATAQTGSDFRLMQEAWDRIHESYVDQPAVDDQLLTYGAIGGMVGARGDTGHSRFLSPEMVQQQHDFTAGGFVRGIGAYLEMKDGHVAFYLPPLSSCLDRSGGNAGFPGPRPVSQHSSGVAGPSRLVVWK